MSLLTTNSNYFFVPQLTLKVVFDGVTFYKKAFGATVLRQWDNPDGSIHVAEMEIGGAMFHLHEEIPRTNQMSVETAKTTTVLLGLFVPDPDALFERAVAAGAKSLGAMQDYEYGYRQGKIADPFGHQWEIEKKI